MTKTVEFFYDFGSPTVYLAATQLPDIAASVGATIDWRPMLIGGVIKSTGHQSPVLVPAQGDQMKHDIKRNLLSQTLELTHKQPDIRIGTQQR